MNIVIGSDFIPTSSNFDLFVAGNIDSLFGENLKSILSNVDYRIFYLETLLSNRTEPIAKYGPALIALEECIYAYSVAKGIY